MDKNSYPGIFEVGYMFSHKLIQAEVLCYFCCMFLHSRAGKEEKVHLRRSLTKVHLRRSSTQCAASKLTTETQKLAHSIVCVLLW